MSGIPSLPPLASTNPATCGPPPPPPPPPPPSPPPPKITGSRLEPEEKEALLSSLPFSLLMLLFLFQRQPGGFGVCRDLCCAVVVALPSRDLIRNYLAIHIFLLFSTISLFYSGAAAKTNCKTLWRRPPPLLPPPPPLPPPPSQKLCAAERKRGKKLTLPLFLRLLFSLPLLPPDFSTYSSIPQKSLFRPASSLYLFLLSFPFRHLEQINEITAAGEKQQGKLSNRRPTMMMMMRW